MLVVPNLAWPILFGENHLKLTQALVNHTNLRIKFQQPDLNFVITMPSFKPRINVNPQTMPSTTGSTNSPSLPGVNVTCILTSMPTPLQDHHRISIQKGLNFVIVCLIFTTSLIGTSLLNQQFWRTRSKCFKWSNSSAQRPIHSHIYFPSPETCSYSPR